MSIRSSRIRGKVLGNEHDFRDPVNDFGGRWDGATNSLMVKKSRRSGAEEYAEAERKVRPLGKALAKAGCRGERSRAAWPRSVIASRWRPIEAGSDPHERDTGLRHQDPCGRGHRGSHRRRRAGIRREQGTGGEGEMAAVEGRTRASSCISSGRCRRTRSGKRSNCST